MNRTLASESLSSVTGLPVVEAVPYLEAQRAALRLS